MQKPFNQDSFWSRISYITVLALLTAFGPVCTDVYLPCVPEITQFFKTDPSAVQMTLTSCFLGIAMGQFFIGPLSDAIGRRGPLLISLVLFAVSSALCAFATGIPMMVACRFLQGLAGGGGLVLARAMAVDVFRGSELTKTMSVLMGIHSIAPVVGPLAGSLIISCCPWEYIFFAMGLWGLLLAALSFFRAPETYVPENADSSLSRRLSANLTAPLQEFRNGNFITLVLASGLMTAGFFGFLSASPYILQKTYGFTPGGYALFFSLNSSLLVLASIVTGILVRKFPEPAIVKTSLAILLAPAAVIFAVALVEPQNPVWFLCGVMCYTFISVIFNTASFTVIMSMRKGPSGAASGIFGVLVYTTGSLAMPLMGIMGDTSIVPLGCDMLFTNIVALAIFVWVLARCGNRKENGRIAGGEPGKESPVPEGATAKKLPEKEN